jgi:Lon-like ATP-dependent protease
MRAGVGEHAPKVPQVLALPVRKPLMPWFLTQLFTTDPAVVNSLRKLHEAGKHGAPSYVGLFLEREPSTAPTGQLATVARNVEDLFETGTLASMQTFAETGSGGAVAWFMAHRRIRIKGAITTDAPPAVEIEHLEQNRAQLRSDMVRALANEIVTVVRDLVRINPMFKEQMTYFTERVEVHDAFRLADFAASATTAEPEDVQGVLEAENLEDRLQLALQLMRKELEVSKLQQKISDRVNESMKDTQRKYLLTEQLKTIKKELGIEKDDKDALVQKFEKRAEGLNMPATAQEVFDEEMDKLRVLERNSSEFNLTRSYLDWMTSLPWGVFSEDTFDLGHAQEVLDADHYGMTDVKERILEFIAVSKLTGSVKGKILCLVGPPGVGKTSIGQSIATALGRQFYRFSVGGLSDVAEIKGHRRTYIGAMPGKLIQCLKATRVSNPLVLIDEVDKMGQSGFRGDPASALLEMLDPNQNEAFMDHYLDTPVDASKVLFLCTANVLDGIPGPLRDRMEVIDLSGYDADEKLQITKRYLEPKARRENGLDGKGTSKSPDSLRLTDDAIRALVRWYCRESGVRNLEKHVNKIYRKAAFKIVLAREKALRKLRVEREEAGLPPIPQGDEDAPAAAAPAAATAGASDGGAPSEEDLAAAPAAATAGASDGGAPSEEDLAARAIAESIVEAQEEVKQAARAAEAAAASPSASPPSASSSAKDETEDQAALRKLREEEAALSAFLPESIPGLHDVDWTIDADALKRYVGKPIFSSDRLYPEAPPGVIMGLAYTSMGGAALYIEVCSPDAGLVQEELAGDEALAEGEASEEKPRRFKPGKGNPPLLLTGKMGDVMQESARIAQSFARSFMRRVAPHNHLLDEASLHLHVPEGATPKDGPSAGCTMVTALLSLAMDRPAVADLAMTGEISLTGKVLPVGGIREKLMAARRAGANKVILPQDNSKDVEELPDHALKGLEIFYAREYKDVFAIAFGAPADEIAAQIAAQGALPGRA